MSSRQLISGQLREVWSKLEGRWKGDAAAAFYRQYILRLSETADSFESACAELCTLSQDLAKELQTIEQSLEN